MIRFQKLYEEAENNFLIYKKRANIIAFIRFLLMMAILISLLTGYFKNTPYLYFISIVLFVIFMMLIMYHDKLKDQTHYYYALRDVYYEHIQRKKGKWDAFINDGSCFIHKNQNISLDIDVFGKHSLFQMINIAFTQRGQTALAKTLIDPQSEYADIIKRQIAVAELAQHHDFIIEIQTLGKMIPQTQTHQLEEFINFSFCKNNKKPIISIVLSFITLLALFASLLQVGTPYSYALLESGFVLQICFAFLTMKRNAERFEPVQRFHKSLIAYVDIFKTIHSMKFQSELLNEIYDSLYSKINVIEGIRELSKISQRVQYRQNIFAFILLNGLFGFDILVSFQLQKWLNQYHRYMDEWFEQLALLESLMSLSVLKIDQEDVVMPVIVKGEQLQLMFQNLKHPLLKKESVIGNDFSAQKRVNIITGSNMSGKTTFMRTIALNLVLAYAGGYVFAEQLECSYMRIMTSMRVKDNVEEGISTFYGELLRIKEMIEYSALKKPMICFIDEIFKGTNSLDRIAGAKATIQKLSLPHCLIFLTTHDFELCQIDHLQCQNYHFNEYYKNKRIYFDYQIKNGPSTSSNGQFLLKQLGIMEEDE